MKTHLAGFLCGIIFLWSFPLSAQFTISGTVREAISGELLSYVRVYDQGSDIGTYTNEYGFFSLSLSQDAEEVCFFLTDFQKTCMSLLADGDSNLTIDLVPLSIEEYQADSILITESQNASLQERQAGHLVIPVRQLANMPSLLGEADALKGLQLLPGVQFGVEGTSGLYIRGGTPEQNLILLDEMPVYNVSHLFGFFSLFPPDALQRVELYRGGFPARYGGRLSSVIRLQTKDGNLDHWKKKLSLSTVATAVSVEGPLKKDQTSLFLSARRSWVDILMRPLSRISLDREGVDGSFGYYFFDAIAKLTHRISDKDRLYLSFYAGRDDNGVSVAFGPEDQQRNHAQGKLLWGNLTTSLRFNHIYSSRLFSNTTIGYTQHRYRSWIENIAEENGEPILSTRMEQASLIRDLIAKHKLEFFPNPNNQWLVGLEASRQQFRPDVRIAQSLLGQTRIDTSFNSRTYTNHYLSVYGEHKWKPHLRFQMHSGLRVERYQLEELGGWSVQPRLSLLYHPSSTLTIKAAYSYVQQYLHLLSSTGLALPADLWAPATGDVPPADSHQGVLGLSFQASRGIEVSLEGYVKQMNGVIAYKDGASYANQFENWEQKVSSGRGQSVGIELLLHKRQGRLNGWLSYTLSKSTRQFPDINGGVAFPFRFDRRHNLSFYTSYALRNPNKRISFTWMFISGAQITAPSTRYNTPYDLHEFLQGIGENPITLQTTTVFGSSAFFSDSRNNLSMRPFHKLDVSFSSTKAKNGRERRWSFGVYNLYGARNPLYVFFDGTLDYDYQTNTVLAQGSLTEYSFLMWIPAIGYQVSF